MTTEAAIPGLTSQITGRPGLRILHSISTVDPQSGGPVEGMKHLKKWLYWPWGEYQVLRHASAVVFTCEQERILARQSFWLYSVRERVVHYGTSDPTLPSGAKTLFENRFPMVRGRRVLLFLGR